MVRSARVPLSDIDLTNEVLQGATIYGRDGESIASVKSLKGVGTDASVIVETLGFLGFGAKTLAIQMRSLQFFRDKTGSVRAETLWNLEELKQLGVDPLS